MTAALALAFTGWAAALALALRLASCRRRFELVARAEHELRGPAAALMLAAERMGRDPRTRLASRQLLLQLERMRAGLADLGAARMGTRVARSPGFVDVRRLAAHAAAGARPLAAAAGRRVRFDWHAGVAPLRADRGRLAQVLANLTANAVEHGSGTVEVRGRERAGKLRLEVRDEGPDARQGLRADADASGRGRGLAIATDAAHEVGGHLSLVQSEEGTAAVLELPLDRSAEPAPDAA